MSKQLSEITKQTVEYLRRVANALERGDAEMITSRCSLRPESFDGSLVSVDYNIEFYLCTPLGAKHENPMA